MKSRVLCTSTTVYSTSVCIRVHTCTRAHYINVVYINYFVAVYLEVESLSDQIVISFS